MHWLAYSFLILLQLSLPNIALAKVFSCVRDNALVYTNKPCEPSAEQRKELKAPPPAIASLTPQQAKATLTPTTAAPATIHLTDQHYCNGEAFIAAAERGQLVEMRSCQQQIDVNQRDSRKNFRGRSALHWASVNGHTDLLRWLLAHGAIAGLRAQRDLGATATHLAAGASNEALAVLVAETTTSETKDYRGRTPLHWAAQAGNLENVVLLLEAGADPNQPDRIGKTPLIAAAQAGHYKVVEKLLERGASPSAKTHQGMTAIHYATNHSRALIDLLIMAGANLEERNQEGQTPLLWALNQITPPPLELLEYLMHAGANILLKDASGQNGLQIAAQRLRSEYSQRLRSLVTPP